MTRHSLVRALGVFFALFAPFELVVAQRTPAIPAGTQIQVRMTDRLTSEKANPGDTFRGSLRQAIVVNGRTLYPKGADVSGRVVSVHRSGRLSDPGELELVLTSVRYKGAWHPLDVQPFRIKGESHAGNNITKIGGGAAAGAIIGGLAGGGKGAAIGAGVGAGAGTTAAAVTGKKEAKVESEAVLTWVAAEPAPAWTGRGDSFRPSERDEERDRDFDRRGAWPEDRDRENRGYIEFSVFSGRDRQLIRSCFSENRANLPPGLAKKDRLPPGLEKQLRRNGTLPPGLEKRVQPLPYVCEVRLPRLPEAWARVVLSRRVLLLDAGQRIQDMFDLDDD